MSSTRRSMTIFYKVLSFLPLLPQEQSFDLLFLFLQAYERWTQRIQNEERLGQPQSVFVQSERGMLCNILRWVTFQACGICAAGTWSDTPARLRRSWGLPG